MKRKEQVNKETRVVQRFYTEWHLVSLSTRNLSTFLIPRAKTKLFHCKICFNKKQRKPAKKHVLHLNNIRIVP